MRHPMVTSTTALSAIVAFVATWSAVRPPRRSHKAERAWVEAISRSEPDVRRLLDDLGRDSAHRARASNTDSAMSRLEHTVTELIDDLVVRGAISAADGAVLLAGLRQPSPDRGSRFARRLAEEALAQRFTPKPPLPTPPYVAAIY